MVFQGFHIYSKMRLWHPHVWCKARMQCNTQWPWLRRYSVHRYYRTETSENIIFFQFNSTAPWINIIIGSHQPKPPLAPHPQQQCGLDGPFTPFVWAWKLPPASCSVRLSCALMKDGSLLFIFWEATSSPLLSILAGGQFGVLILCSEQAKFSFNHVKFIIWHHKKRISH